MILCGNKSRVKVLPVEFQKENYMYHKAQISTYISEATKPTDVNLAAVSCIIRLNKTLIFTEFL